MVILVYWNQFNEMALVFTFSISFQLALEILDLILLFPLWTRRPVMSKLSGISARKQDPKSWFFEKSWKNSERTVKRQNVAAEGFDEFESFQIPD